MGDVQFSSRAFKTRSSSRCRRLDDGGPRRGLCASPRPEFVGISLCCVGRRMLRMVRLQTLSCLVLFFLSSDTANLLIKWNDHSGCILRKDQKGKCSLLFSWVISTDIFEFTAAPVCHIRLAGTLITRIFLLTRGFLVVRRDFH